MKSRKIMFLSVAAIMSLVACNNQPNSKKDDASSKVPETSVKQKDPNEVSVFVLSGQSNMEGQTDVGNNNSYLTAAFETLGITDGGDCITGINSVLTSFYGNGYGELSRDDYNTGGQRSASSQPHASNTEDSDL